MTGLVTTYSMVSANPVMNPPHGPIAARANEYAPPVCGMAADISPIEKIIVKYMTVTRTMATSIGTQPVVPRPTSSSRAKPATPWVTRNFARFHVR